MPIGIDFWTRVQLSPPPPEKDQVNLLGLFQLNSPYSEFIVPFQKKEEGLLDLVVFLIFKNIFAFQSSTVYYI